MTSDPFAPARRAVWIGPLVMVIGGALLYTGIAAEANSWLFIAGGGVCTLLGFLRFVGGAAVLGMERRRKELLREGEPSTATVNTSKQLGTRSGYPIFESALVVKAPDGTTSTVVKKGAVPPQFVGSLEPGTELPIKIRPSDKEFAIDWDAF